MEIIIGAMLATALLFIGQCWGKQTRVRHYHITVTPEKLNAAMDLGREADLWHTGVRK